MHRQFLRFAAGVLSLAAVIPSLAYSGNLDVLWFTAGTGDGGSFASYEDGVRNLAQQASQISGQNVWNVTFWNAGFDPVSTPPVAYNVMVVASPQFVDGADYSSLNSNFPTLGNRVVVTGIDADWHYLNSPGPADFNGPFGFLANAVNWAGAGTGLGAVFLAPQTNVAWSLNGLGNEVSYDNLDNIAIPDGAGTHPINSGLTADGLSNWGTSAKEAWDTVDSSRWSVLHVNGDDPTTAVTLVSVNTQSGLGVPGSPTPEAATAPLLLTAGTCIWLLRRKRII